MVNFLKFHQYVKFFYQLSWQKYPDNLQNQHHNTWTHLKKSIYISINQYYWFNLVASYSNLKLTLWFAETCSWYKKSYLCAEDGIRQEQAPWEPRKCVSFCLTCIYSRGLSAAYRSILFSFESARKILWEKTKGYFSFAEHFVEFALLSFR